MSDDSMQARRTVSMTFVMSVTGWAAVVCLIVVTLTGILLSMYYVPTMAGRPLSYAAQSVVRIETDVVGGTLIRAVHHHATSILVACALLWLGMSTWYAKEVPTRMWSAVGLALVAFVGAWTGRLLPDDAYAATSRDVMRFGLSEAHGGSMVSALLGLRTLPDVALAATYSMHGVVMLACVVILAWRLRRHIEQGNTGHPSWMLAAAVVVIAHVVMLVLAPRLVIPGSALDIHTSHPWWMFMPLHRLTDALGAELVSIMLWFVAGTLITLPWWANTVDPRRLRVVGAGVAILYFLLLFA